MTIRPDSKYLMYFLIIFYLVKPFVLLIFNNSSILEAHKDEWENVSSYPRFPTQSSSHFRNKHI